MDRERAIASAQKGEEEGFRWLFEHHRLAVFRLLRGRFRLTEDEANDVLQATFIKAFRGLTTLRDAGKYDAWLLTICRREALRYLERQRPEATGQDEPLDVACERQQRLAELEEKERLLALIARTIDHVTPDAVRETARRYYLGEPPCTTEALGRELDVPHATVRKRLYLFRNKLRAALQEEMEA